MTRIRATLTQPGVSLKAAALTSPASPSLTDQTNTTADAIIAAVSTAIPTGADLISRADLNARLVTVNANFADITAAYNTLRTQHVELVSQLRAAGVLT